MVLLIVFIFLFTYTLSYSELSIFFFLGFRTIDLPVFCQCCSSFLYFFNHLIFLVGEFTADINMPVFRSINNEIIMTCIRSFVRFVTNKLNIFVLIFG